MSLQLPVEAALPILSEVIDHTAGESVMASPEVIAVQDSADSPRDLPSPSPLLLLGILLGLSLSRS